MRSRNRGAANIALVGGGLLMLVVVVGIIMSLSSMSADSALRAKRSADVQIDHIESAEEIRRQHIDQMTDEMSGQAEGQGEFTVLLFDPGPNREAVAEVISQARRTSVAQAQALLENLPATVLTDVSRDRAEQTRDRLAAAGALVDLQRR